MAVVVFLLAHRNHAAVGNFAIYVLELDGGVVDVELLVEAGLYVAQDAFAYRRRNVGDGNVAGQGAGFRSDVPDVQVVDVVDAFDGANRGCDAVDLNAARGAFEQDVQGLAHDAGAGPENQHADTDGKSGINPQLARCHDGPAAGNNCRGGKRVSDLMQKDAADIDVAAGAVEQQGDDSIHDDAGGGDGHHGSGVYRLRILQASERLVEDEERDDDQ